MFDQSNTLVGLLCLAGGILMGIFYPRGPKRGQHLFFNLVIILLFVFAAFNLIPATLIADDATVLLVGLAVGTVVVIIRSFRRWVKYFQGAVSRRFGPYYWYGRYYRRRRRYR